MRKVLIIGLFGVLAAGIVFVLIRHPELFGKVYLWIIGLFGLITWPFRKLWDWLNTNDDLNEVNQSNQQLKRELEQIKKDLARARRTLEEERRKNKSRIAQLENKIKSEDQAARAIQQELAVLKKQSPEEFKDSLPPDERKKIQEDLWKEVDFGL